MLFQRMYPLAKRGGSGAGAGGLAVVLSANNIYAYSPTPGATVTTITTTATASGGTSPYTYAWDTVMPIAAASPSSATTAFTTTGFGAANDFTQSKRCTVTDSVGATAFATCSVEIQIGGSINLGGLNGTSVHISTLPLP